ncbi:homocysteine S-methyltransferase [Sarracenia purpurea var. burkii]
MLAFETQACVELLEEENIRIPSWICFSSVDGENAPSEMSPFRAQSSEVFESSEKSPKMEALGVGVGGFGNPLLEEMNQQSPLVFPDPWSLILGYVQWEALSFFQWAGHTFGLGRFHLIITKLGLGIGPDKENLGLHRGRLI